MNYIWVSQKMYAHDMQFGYLILSYWTEGSGFLSSTYQRETKQGNFYITRKTNFSCVQENNRILIDQIQSLISLIVDLFIIRNGPRWKKCLCIHKFTLVQCSKFKIVSYWTKGNHVDPFCRTAPQCFVLVQGWWIDANFEHCIKSQYLE